MIVNAKHASNIINLEKHRAWNISKLIIETHLLESNPNNLESLKWVKLEIVREWRNTTLE